MSFGIAKIDDVAYVDAARTGETCPARFESLEGGRFGGIVIHAAEAGPEPR